jgi:hypothetical protein
VLFLSSNELSFDDKNCLEIKKLDILQAIDEPPVWFYNQSKMKLPALLFAL